MYVWCVCMHTFLCVSLCVCILLWFKWIGIFIIDILLCHGVLKKLLWSIYVFAFNSFSFEVLIIINAFIMHQIPLWLYMYDEIVSKLVFYTLWTIVVISGEGRVRIKALYMKHDNSTQPNLIVHDISHSIPVYVLAFDLIWFCCCCCLLKYLCACILHLINLYCTWAAKPQLRFPKSFAETGMMWVFCFLQEFLELCNGRDEGSFQVREKEGEECVFACIVVCVCVYSGVCGCIVVGVCVCVYSGVCVCLHV